MSRLLEKTFLSQKIESVSFYSCPQAKLSTRFLSSPLQANHYSFSPNSVFYKSIFPQPKWGEGYGAEKIIKLKLVRVLVTRFDKFHHFTTFTFLVSVLKCHSLDSSMLKCSLTFTKKNSVQE